VFNARLYKPAPDPHDSVAALIDFASGATGVMATVRAGPTYWRLHVFGTKGWAEALGETRLTVTPIGQEPQTQTLPATDSLAALLDQFAQAVEGARRRKAREVKGMEWLAAKNAVPAGQSKFMSFDAASCASGQAAALRFWKHQRRKDDDTVRNHSEGADRVAQTRARRCEVVDPGAR
jgi:predicted dehydrogenase